MDPVSIPDPHKALNVPYTLIMHASMNVYSKAGYQTGHH